MAQVTYYPDRLAWEVEGEETDSKGEAKHRAAPVEALRIGLR